MPDVFISYAHADDEVPSGAEYGWVTTFKEELRKRLRQKLGAAGADIWMDHSLAANENVTPTLLRTLRDSRTLLLFLSPSYQKSKWCQDEVGEFLEHNHTHKNKESVFIVELEPVDRSNWHPRLRELTPICFWERTPVDPVPRLFGYPSPEPIEKNPYWLRLNELAHLIADHLKTMAAPPTGDAPSAGDPRSRQPATRPTIWVADPTSDMIGRWYELSATIRQHRCELRPSGPGLYDYTDRDRFSFEVRKHLEESALAIQLMGASPGEPLPGSTTNGTALQHALAREWARTTGRAFMQWRPSETSAEPAARTEYGALLTGAIACGFAEFCKLVVTTLEALDQSAPARSTIVTPRAASIGPTIEVDAAAPMTICVTSAQQDKDLGSQVADILFDLGANTLAPPDREPDQLPSDFNALLDRIIENSEGVVIVYGHTQPAWVQAQYTQAWRVLAQRPPGLWGALLDGPPLTKPPHGVRSRNLMTLDCRAGSMRESLARFVASLRRASHA